MVIMDLIIVEFVGRAESFTGTDVGFMDSSALTESLPGVPGGY